MNNQENTPKAILLMLLGMSVFAIQDALIKIISSETNLFLIYLPRSLIGGTLLYLYLYIRKEPIIFKTHYPKLTILRGCLFFISFTLYYFSLTKLSQHLLYLIILPLQAYVRPLLYQYTLINH